MRATSKLLQTITLHMNYRLVSIFKLGRVLQDYLDRES